MKTSLGTYRTEITNAILDFVVDQWRILGNMPTPPRTAAIVVDPEVLIALTTSVGRYDSRVFDGMVAWLARNDAWINVQRLGRIAIEDGVANCAALGAVVAWLAAQGRSLKWRGLAAKLRPPDDTAKSPLFLQASRQSAANEPVDDVFARYGFRRAPFVLREHAPTVRLKSPGALFCTSRAVFGVSVRADVMAFLAVNDHIHARGLAGILGYNHMQIRTVLVALEQAGIATVRSSGRTRQYSIDRETWQPVLFGKEPAAEWVNWRSLARGIASIMAGLGAIDARRADDTVAESLVRDVVRAARNSFLTSHPQAAHSRGLSRIIGPTLAGLMDLDAHHTSSLGGN